MLNIKGLLLGNFRIFSGTTHFRLAPLTVITGANSSGKSTLAGSLSIMKGLDTIHLPYRLRLDSSENAFGNFGTMLTRNAKHKLFPAGYDLYNAILGENIRVMMTFEKGGDFDAAVRRISITGSEGNIFDFRFRDNKIETKIGVGYLYRKLREIKESRKYFCEIERDFKSIRSSSGAYREAASGSDQVRIFHVDRESRKKNLSGYLRSHNISEGEYERMFYFFGKFRNLPGNGSGENDFIERTRKVLSGYDETQILFNNDILKKILEIPHCDLSEEAIDKQIKKELPELSDCLALLKNPEMICNIADLLKVKTYREWEEDFTEPDLTTSRNMNGLKSYAEFGAAIDHHLQSRFDISDFIRAITELSMTREGFLQSYSRNENVKALSSFCLLLLDKIIHDLQTDISRTFSLSLDEAINDTTLDFKHPLYSHFKSYSATKEKDSFLKKWLGKFNVCEDFTCEPSDGIGYRPSLVKNGERLPLAMEGTGLKRLVVMLLGMTNSRCFNDVRDFNDDVRYYPATVVLEAPEAFFHQSWQSKLGDVLADARHQLGLHFIIETHSEYLINKLQYLVATGRLSKDDVLIYHLDNNTAESSSPAVREIVLDENGNLSSDIPGGFLDDDDRRAVGLFRLKKVSRN